MTLISFPIYNGVMIKGRKIITFVVVVAAASGLLVTSCGQRATPNSTAPITIKVGLPTPLTDPEAPWGQANVEPYLAWVDLFNQTGFEVAGKTYQFQIVMADDHDSQEGGTAVAQQLVYQDGCRFLAGHWSWSYDAISAITNPAKVIFVTRTGAGIHYDPKTQPYNVFGSASKEAWVADVLATHEAFPDRKIGLLEPTSGLTPAEIAEINRQSFDPAGMNYEWEVYPADTTDFTPYFTKLTEDGCNLVYSDAGFSTTTALLKQRWDAGYDWPLGQGGGLAPIEDYVAACGYQATQGLIGSYFGIWDFKETKVDPKYITMCQQVMKALSQKHGGDYTYNDWIGWLPSHLLILSQAMEKAGTVDDPDAIMAAIRGGTFDSTGGTCPMSGQKTYGSPVVFGNPGAICIVQGSQAVYLAEHPVDSIP
jgi:ABC-type branched-subunit amino acid transport system substrate-binding protein